MTKNILEPFNEITTFYETIFTLFYDFFDNVKIDVETLLDNGQYPYLLRYTEDF